MPKFCGECGFALDKEYNFCPNCGSKIELSTDRNENFKKEEKEKIEVIICSICGEENPSGSTACVSCGAVLSENSEKEIKETITKKSSTSDKKLNNKKPVQQKNKKKNKETKKEIVQNSNVKELNNKLVFGIAGGIVAVVILVLFLSGVFENTTTQVNVPNQQTSSGINLNNLNEIADLEKKVTANPDDMQSLLSLAHLQNDSGLYEKAIINYQKYLDKNPTDADARIDMGVCYYNLRNFDNAIAEMSKALEYAPKHQIGHLNLGIVNLSAGNVQKAKEWLQKAVELDPNSDAGQRAKELLNSH